MRSIYKQKYNSLQFFIILILISLSLTGSDCDKILENNTEIPQEMIGDWRLDGQSGALQDICADENVNFQSTGIALLTCPNSTTISREFTVQNNVLKYTQSEISYSIQTLTSDTLYLLGQNVSRNLLYLKFVATDKPNSTSKNTDLLNSSEIRK